MCVLRHTGSLSLSRSRSRSGARLPCTLFPVDVPLLIFSSTLGESTSMTRTGLLGFANWLLVVAVGGLVAQPVTYDQRQEGKVNVQVDVKDLQIVALVSSDMLADYNYDYALYDEADFTVKPSTRRTTVKASSTTNEPASTSASTSESSSSTRATEESVVVEDSASSMSNPGTTTEINIVESTSDKQRLGVDAATKLSELSTTAASATAANAEKRPFGTTEARKRCPTGFQMRSGRCFKRRHSLISPRLALLKLAPALLGKSHLFNGHSTTGSSYSN